LFAEVGLGISVSPMLRSFSLPDEERETTTINHLQNQMLEYRLRNFARVKSSQFDAPDFSGSTRELARTLGRCVVGAPDLQGRLLELLRSRNDAEKTEVARGLEAVVVEALVAFCHERRSSVHVGEVAQFANAILTRNEESLQLSFKQAGTKLKQLGFRTTRLDSAGRGIHLLKEQCARIHKLGRAFGVPTLREGLKGCPHCNPG
jgi:hypothetical protein